MELLNAIKTDFHDAKNKNHRVLENALASIISLLNNRTDDSNTSVYNELVITTSKIDKRINKLIEKRNINDQVESLLYQKEIINSYLKNCDNGTIEPIFKINRKKY